MPIHPAGGLYNLIMKIYFVRHGESFYNRIDKHQDEKVGLSDYGIKQAEKVAARIEKIPVEIIFSSHYRRAKQTAEIIAKAIHKKVHIVKLLHEFKNPTEVENKAYDDPEAMRIKKIIIDHANDPNYHYSDEENFFDFRKRAKQFWQFLSKQKEKHILVVTHATFLRILITDLIFGDNLTNNLCRQFISRVYHANTGITVCERDEKGNWHLLTWNDHAHLG